nr:MAG TPA: hypothetical protein [Caudoviricetes sp.]
MSAYPSSHIIAFSGRATIATNTDGSVQFN